MARTRKPNPKRGAGIGNPPGAKGATTHKLVYIGPLALGRGFSRATTTTVAKGV